MATSTRALRVLIADDEVTVRNALADLIRTDTTLELVGAASSAREAADLAESTQPDVALVDVRMPGGGVSATRAMRMRSPRTRVLALSASGSADTVVDMLRAGAAGYLVKGEMPAAILDGIHRVAEGRLPLSAEIADGVVRDLSDRLQSDAAVVEERRRRMEQIDVAVRGDALRMVFQPILDLGTRHVAGYEALARFTLAGQRTPDYWFTEAAALGRGVDLEVAALRAAERDCGEMPPNAYLAVNAAPTTLVDAVGQQALADIAGARSLVIEVTEHAPVEDYAALRRALAPLAALGARLAVDDVGAGFASLRHIVKLGPDILKLDISLTRGIDGDPALQEVATALIGFASRTGKDVVAEGIETEEELVALQGLGVRLGQGYHLGRPGPLPS